MDSTPDITRRTFLVTAAAGAGLAATTTSTSSAEVVGIQPSPVRTIVSRLGKPPGTVTTSIVRLWAPGHAAHCRLCPRGRCTAHGDLCLITVRGNVTDKQAPLFDSTGLVWQET